MEGVITEVGLDIVGRNARDTVRIEVSLPGESEPKVLELLLVEDLLNSARQALGLGEEVLIFALDGDEPLATAPPGRKALRLTAHKARELTVKVNYEHLTKDKKFPPSKTVFKVLQWAVGKHGFNLDPTSAARANLILLGNDQPLPREAPISSFVPPGEHALVVDLTLKDFTNGGR
jgi:hypothetical protein